MSSPIISSSTNRSYDSYTSSSCSPPNSLSATNLPRKPQTLEQLPKIGDDNKVTIRIQYDDPKSHTINPTQRITFNGKDVASQRSSSPFQRDITTKTRFQERPIDVPPDFEREAYSRLLNHNRSPIRRKLKVPERRLHPMLKEFLEEDWVTVDPDEALNRPSTEHIDRSPHNHRRYSSHETVDMGNKSSKAKKKSSKLDKSRYKSSSELASKSSKNPFDLISKIRIVKPAQSSNPFDEEEDEPDEPSDIDPNKDAKEAILRRLEPHIHSASTSAFFRAHQPVFSSESIHQNSILYRSNEILSARKRSVVREHIRKEAIPVRIPNARRRSQGGGRSDERFSEPIRPFDVYRRRLGGSFQTLLMNKRSKSRAGGGFSASETNISALRDGQTYQDYCPSGFYNRISLLRRENVVTTRPNTMKRWKHFWTVNFQRKRKVIDSSNP